MKLFNSWGQIELSDALPLLSIKFAANPIYKEELENNRQLANTYNEIRGKAVKCLEKQTTAKLKSIMLQLV